MRYCALVIALRLGDPVGQLPLQGHGLKVGGSQTLDDGAIKALASGKSLLPVGVTSVAGEFERGAVVACRDAQGRELARGLINYPSGEARRIARKGSHEIEAILGYVDALELIHRDNLVLI
jgi:glutamate 5-kinase